MMPSKHSSGIRTGLIVFSILAALSAIEFLLAIFFNVWPLIALVALIEGRTGGLFIICTFIAYSSPTKAMTMNLALINWQPTESGFGYSLFLISSYLEGC